MRKLVVAASMLGAISCAHAADMPDLPLLRGGLTEFPIRSIPVWQGYYVGGQAAYGVSEQNFTGSNSALTARLLANTLVESEMGISRWPLSFGRASGTVSGFGGFVGYNSQWDDVVVGVETNYIHGQYGGQSTGSMTRFALLSDNDYHSVTSSSTSAIDIKDSATFRARAGYAIGGFLPYAFGGFALGRADLVKSVAVSDIVTAGPNSTTPAVFLGPRGTLTATQAQYNRLIYGYSAGVGVDVNVIGGLFVRAEYEYIRFTSAVDTIVNTGRVGLGYKF